MSLQIHPICDCSMVCLLGCLANFMKYLLNILLSWLLMEVSLCICLCVCMHAHTCLCLCVYLCVHALVRMCSLPSFWGGLHTPQALNKVLQVFIVEGPVTSKFCIWFPCKLFSKTEKILLFWGCIDGLLGYCLSHRQQWLHEVRWSEFQGTNQLLSQLHAACLNA
jgi:hypothetical protein